MDRKEAIEIVRKNYPHVGVSGSEFETALRELVPELKESEDERIRKMLIEIVNITPSTLAIENRSELLSYLERQKEKKMPVPEYCGENKRYPTEYCLDQDTRKKLIALVEKFGQEEDKDEMLDYLETYQPVQSASEVKEFNFQPGDPDEKAIKRLKAMIYFAFDETSEVPMDEACALDDWLDDKCKPEEWSEGKIPKDIEKDAVQFCFDKGLNVTPYQAKQIASHYLRIGHNEGYVEGRKNAHIPAKDLGLPSSMDYKHEWGKEDEEKLSAVISLMKSSRAVNPFYDKMCLEGWLKPLRRQPAKAELTLLDKNIINAAVAFVEQNNHFNYWGGIDKQTVIKALRSLKPSWKPSEEQMEALKDAFRKDGGNEYRKVINSLYRDLEKLL